MEDILSEDGDYMKSDLGKKIRYWTINTIMKLFYALCIGIALFLVYNLVILSSNGQVPEMELSRSMIIQQLVYRSVEAYFSDKDIQQAKQALYQPLSMMILKTKDNFHMDVDLIEKVMRSHIHRNWEEISASETIAILQFTKAFRKEIDSYIEANRMTRYSSFPVKETLTAMLDHIKKY